MGNNDDACDILNDFGGNFNFMIAAIQFIGQMISSRRFKFNEIQNAENATEIMNKLWGYMENPSMAKTIKETPLYYDVAVSIGASFLESRFTLMAPDYEKVADNNYDSATFDAEQDGGYRICPWTDKGDQPQEFTGEYHYFGQMCFDLGFTLP